MSVQLGILLGALTGLGALLIVSAVLPNHPQLPAALARMTPSHRWDAEPSEAEATVDLRTRIGAGADRVISRWTQLSVPEDDLALLRTPRARHIADKVIAAALGLAVPYLITAFAGMLGLSLGIAIPVAASIAGAAIGYLGPDVEIRSRARAARQAFLTDITTYIDLVAQERRSGAGIATALTAAANVGDSPAFVRLREDLARAQFTGLQPWQALEQLAEDVNIPEIAELGSTMQLAGTKGSATYDQLRSQALTLRRTQLAEETAKAGAATERMRLPTAMMALVFMAMLITPALLNIVGI